MNATPGPNCYSLNISPGSKQDCLRDAIQTSMPGNNRSSEASDRSQIQRRQSQALRRRPTCTAVLYVHIHPDMLRLLSPICPTLFCSPKLNLSLSSKDQKVACRLLTVRSVHSPQSLKRPRIGKRPSSSSTPYPYYSRRSKPKRLR
jgi:hypothetical protein